MKPELKAMLLELGEEMARQDCKGFEFCIKDGRDGVYLAIDLLRMFPSADV